MFVILLRGSLSSASAFCKGQFFRWGVAAAILAEQFFRAFGQHSAYFAAFAFHSWDDHAIAARRLMPQPGECKTRTRIMNLDQWNKDRQKVGTGNLENFNSSLERMTS